MPASIKTRSLKDQVRDAIEQLPEDCTAEDIHYRLYLIEKIRRGEASLGKVAISHAEVKKRAAAWRRK